MSKYKFASLLTWIFLFNWEIIQMWSMVIKHHDILINSKSSNIVYLHSWKVRSNRAFSFIHFVPGWNLVLYYLGYKCSSQYQMKNLYMFIMQLGLLLNKPSCAENLWFNRFLEWSLWTFFLLFWIHKHVSFFWWYSNFNI